MEDELKRLREVNASLLSELQAVVAWADKASVPESRVPRLKQMRAAIALANGTEKPLTHVEMVQETLRRC